MSSPAAPRSPISVPARPARPRLGLGHQLHRWLTLAGLVAVALVCWRAGYRDSGLGDLQDYLHSGGRTEVLVENDRNPQAQDAMVDPGDGGEEYLLPQTWTADVYWRDGLIGRHVEVQARRGPDPDRVLLTVERPHGSSTGDYRGRSVGDAIRSMGDGVRVEQRDWASGVTGSIDGWQVRGAAASWVLPLMVLVWGSALVLLVTGPEPRYATRWAWFWLLATPPGFLGLAAFLLLGMRGAVPGSKRLTGGWAFLISLFLP